MLLFLFSALTLLQTPASLAFTWVDGMKIVLIPILLFVLNRAFSRRDKSTDEQRAKKDAEAKTEKEAVKTELKRLADAIGQFVDKEALERRFGKLEGEQARQDKRMEGFQGQSERMGDDSARRFQSLETQMNEMGRFREDMAGVKAKVDALSEGIRDMNNKLDMLLQRQLK